MFCLFDDFNAVVISRHRTLKGVAIGYLRWWYAFKRNNAPGSYLPVSFRVRVGDEWILLTDGEKRQIERMIENN